MNLRQLWLYALCSAALGACKGGPDELDDPGSDTITAAGADVPLQTVPEIGDCDALARSAEIEARDAGLLPVLCPDHVLTTTLLRRILLAVASPRAAAEALPVLAAEPDLARLAQLAAYRAPATDPPTDLPRPSEAPVSPVTPEVLANVQLAHALLHRRNATADDRTRAEAYLAKVHIQALQQLGYARGRALPPFARLLAARALHHGRRFCTAYWQRRVLGLETLFAETEVWLLELVLALEQTEHAGDGALLSLERQRARRYVQRAGPRARIERRLRDQPATAKPASLDALLPLANEIDRLLDHGFVDLAVSRALLVATDSSSYGIDPMTDLLAERLTAKDLDEHMRLLEMRRKELLSRSPPPAAKGPREIEAAVPTPWPATDEVADEVVGWLEAFDEREGLARKHALGRAAIELVDRPDVTAELLERAARGDAKLARFAPMLLALEETCGQTGLGALRRKVQLETTSQTGDPEGTLRRGFALAARETTLQR